MTASPDPAASKLSDADFERETLDCLGDVLRFAKSLARGASDAEDLVQETYLRAYRGRDTFQAGSGARQWLFTICRNVFLRSRDRERWVTAVGDDAELEVLATVGLHAATSREGLEDVFDRVDFGPALERAMGALAEPYRVAFALVDVGGHSYADAAAALGIPVGTVRSRLFRARRELQCSLVEFARDAGLVPAAPEAAPRSLSPTHRKETD